MNEINQEYDLPFSGSSLREIKSSIEEWAQMNSNTESAEYFWFRDQLNQQLDSCF